MEILCCRNVFMFLIVCLLIENFYCPVVCSEMPLCEDTANGPMCSCPIGFKLLLDLCEDIEECSYQNGQCQQICVNTVGSYRCECPIGYRLAKDNHRCEDIEECSYQNGQCQQICVNTVGSYRCECQIGYRLTKDNHRCEDIEECSYQNGQCQQICVNTVGSYRCECQIGYRLTKDNHRCEDFNECLVNPVECDEQQICINTRGGSFCVGPFTSPSSQTLVDESHDGPVLLTRDVMIGLTVWLVILTMLTLLTGMMIISHSPRKGNPINQTASYGEEQDGSCSLSNRELRRRYPEFWPRDIMNDAITKSSDDTEIEQGVRF